MKRGLSMSLELVKGVLVSWSAPASTVWLSSSSSEGGFVKQPINQRIAASTADVVSGESDDDGDLMETDDEAGETDTKPEEHGGKGIQAGPRPLLDENRHSLKAPRIPALIVTQPSTFSMVSSSSTMSSISMEFPLPPLNLEPALFWQKMEDEINSSLALRRRSKSF